MSNVLRTDIDALNGILTVTLAKEDYLTKVKADIKKYSQRVAMKGFRPGKTPATVVKKMYGQAFLMEAVNETLQKQLNEYLETEKPDIFGQPISSVEQPKLKFDLNDPQDLIFNFDIAFLPQFEIQGLDGVTYEMYKVQVDEEKVSAELETLRKRQGEEIEATDNIQDGDMVTLHIKEQGGSVEKEDLLLSMNWITEEMRDVFMTQKKGSQLTINIFQLEKDTTPQYVRKYFLGLEENDDREVNENFDVTIKLVKRQVIADMNQEFYQKAFGEGVTDEMSARMFLRNEMGRSYVAQSEALLLRDLQDKLMEANPLPLPEGFLKRWLKTQNDKNTDETVEKGFDSFAQNMRWTLIRSNVSKSANIQITDEDLKESYRAKIRSYLGGQPIGDEFIESLVDRVMNDEKQFSNLYEDVLTEKTFEAMKARIIIVDKPIGVEEFNSIMAAAQYDASKARGEISEQEPAEVDNLEVTEAS